MDLRKRDLIVSVSLSVLLLISSSFPCLVCANGVFKVRRKFGGRGQSLYDLKAHDVRRRGRILGAVDVHMGGLGLPSEAGLYFAEIGVGTPPKSYYVQVDTGSDILWVNCIGCRRCPRKSDLGIKLTLYDLKESSTGSVVTCDQPFCTSAFDGQIPGCSSDVPCQYSVLYGDGSTTTGYYVQDTLEYNLVTGNLQTAPANATVVFGCGAQQSGDLGSSSEAVDGILGFGQANSSMLSQLASAGKVKKMFAHCLDTVNGGGIFAIGHVVQPKMKTTPLVPNQPHYNVNLKAIEVGNTVLNLPTDVFESGDRKGTIIDSGTTLAYLPDAVYTPLVDAILASQRSLSLQTVQEFTCFHFSGSVDDGFPPVTLHFEDSLTLTIYAHEYLFQIREDAWCLGWQNSGIQSKDAKDMILLGGITKLLLY
ncbi:aspartic proteinase 36-like isoform X2 [Magnolia sinica]|uniref:aspartic proteinase 36-like isoform X2 n=1 Tax=Magnolia sinica TaxID=86752 RepID=UPI0026581CAC|nr:aspartic proteinase 36-like isoform X2 [Magnolia sinica]